MLKRFLLASVLVLPLILLGCAKKLGTSKAGTQTKEAETVGMTVTDPVCGMEIKAKGDFTAQYQGKTYHFCSSSCKNRFEKEPEKFLK